MSFSLHFRWALTGSGLPITYGLFPGNHNDVTTFNPMVNHVQEEYGMRNIIYIADKGMMSGMNIASLILNRNGFVISASVRNSSNEIKQYVLDQEGYTENADSGGATTFKYKERFFPTIINVKKPDGKKKKETVNIRQIVFYSEKYKERARNDRAKAIEKALKNMQKNPKDAAMNTHGANKYIEKTIFDGNSDSLVENPEIMFSIKEEFIAEQEALDGYYLLYTNVFHSDTCRDDIPYFSARDNCLNIPEPATTQDIIDMYKGFWQIEHCFRLSKSYLDTRPLYVWTPKSIEAHFLSCYVALVMLRMMEKRTNHRIEVETLVDELRKAMVTEIDDDTFRYQSCYCSNVIDAVGKAFDLPLNKKRFRDGEFKKLLAKTKKR